MLPGWTSCALVPTVGASWSPAEHSAIPSSGPGRPQQFPTSDSLHTKEEESTEGTQEGQTDSQEWAQLRVCVKLGGCFCRHYIPLPLICFVCTNEGTSSRLHGLQEAVPTFKPDYPGSKMGEVSVTLFISSCCSQYRKSAVWNQRRMRPLLCFPRTQGESGVTWCPTTHFMEGSHQGTHTVGENLC